MAAVMQPPPSVDRTGSFDQPQPRRHHSPFTPGSAGAGSSTSTSHYDNYNSYPEHQRSASPPTLSPYHAPIPPFSHSRNTSNASSVKASPYQQPFNHNHNSYFPNQVPQNYPQHQQQHMYGLPHHQQQQAWATAAIPSTAFYSAAPFQGYSNAPVFNPGFQQSQGDFAAWASAYQHMMMAANQGQQHQHHGYHDQNPQQTEYLQEERRRTNSDVRQSSVPRASFESAIAQQPPRSHSSAEVRAPNQQQGGFHPYKRTPGHRPSRENMHNAMPKSTLQPTLSAALAVPASSEHRRSISAESAKARPDARVTGPPAVNEREVPRQAERQPEVARVVSPKPRTSASTPPPMTTTKTVTPLHPGPITNAINTPAARPSPLSQPTASPEPEKKGLRGRLRKALTSDSAAKKISAPPPTSPVKPILPPATFTSPSETSTRSATPPITPPQPHLDDHVPLRAPAAPFTITQNPNAMNSEISLAETTQTATTAQTDFGGPSKEKKKSLFRMKNMSTDNISLSSTVSSASMMIRKMGSLGKLARRNSLAGISKIFKEKSKDEDGPLPEKDAKKKDKKDKKDKKNKSKGDVVPATVSHATAEPDRTSGEDDDRALAGLSPAAKLARQHTLRSKAEADEAAQKRGISRGTGEPTWDNNTSTRAGVHLPSIDSVTFGSLVGPPSNAHALGPEVLRVQPRHTPTVHHAHAVNVVADQEYDSDVDSSDEEDDDVFDTSLHRRDDYGVHDGVEDVTQGMHQTRLSEDNNSTLGSASGSMRGTIEGDEEFKARWGNVWIDRAAQPKKGILKHAASFTEGADYTLRSQSSIKQYGQAPQLSHPMPNGLGGGLVRDPNSLSSLADFDPPSPTRTRFNLSHQHHDPSFSNGPHGNGIGHGIYASPQHNSSAPSLSLSHLSSSPKPPLASRSMTTPARKRLNWAPECAVYATYDAGTYDRRSEVSTCNRLTPELAMAIKQELNAFKLEMPVHPASKLNTHYFA